MDKPSPRPDPDQKDDQRQCDQETDVDGVGGPHDFSELAGEQGNRDNAGRHSYRRPESEIAKADVGRTGDHIDQGEGRQANAKGALLPAALRETRGFRDDGDNTYA